mmetsp:Transcript_121036/g.270521  ORF Transcript_121036/g.270521 Transcript_121036/m.270521 type:complete len:205 (+) Transcript_121036:554-1168(+)
MAVSGLWHVASSVVGRHRSGSWSGRPAELRVARSLQSAGRDARFFSRRTCTGTCRPLSSMTSDGQSRCRQLLRAAPSARRCSQGPRDERCSPTWPTSVLGNLMVSQRPAQCGASTAGCCSSMSRGLAGRRLTTTATSAASVQSSLSTSAALGCGLAPAMTLVVMVISLTLWSGWARQGAPGPHQLMLHQCFRSSWVWHQCSRSP